MHYKCIYSFDVSGAYSAIFSVYQCVTGPL